MRWVVSVCVCVGMEVILSLLSDTLPCNRNCLTLCGFTLVQLALVVKCILVCLIVNSMVWTKMIINCFWKSLNALTPLVGWEEGHLACKNWLVRYWCSYLSGARCKWFAYEPADATATPSSLAPVKSRMVYRSGAGLPRLSWKKGH